MAVAQSVEEKRKEFEELAIQHMDSLYNVALGMTKDVTKAQDLAQDAYLRAYRFFDKFERGTNFKAWLFKVLKNVYINIYRKEVKEPYINDIDGLKEADEPRTMENPEDKFFNEILDEEIVNAVDNLPDEYREVMELRLKGLAYKKIAGILNIPIGTVMSRLGRGRNLMRESLYDYAREHGYV